MQNYRLHVSIKFGSYVSTLILLAAILTANTVLAIPENCRDLDIPVTPELEALWKDFDTLSSAKMQGRKPGTEGSKLSREYIVEQYSDAGLVTLPGIHPATENSLLFDESGWFHLFERSNSQQGANVIGVSPGRRYPEKYIVVTAHYDHLGTKKGKIFYGANDNASGVAAMLFIARKFKENSPRHSVLLLATDQEESGLYGAKAFLADEVISKQQILLNINLDMIAQPGKKWRLYIAGTRKQPEFIGASDEAISASPICVERGLDYPSWNYNRRFKIDLRKASDHYVFAKQDIPWLYLGAKDYRYYHTPRDTVDKIPQAFYFGSAITAYQLVFAMDKHFSGFQ